MTGSWIALSLSPAVEAAPGAFPPQARLETDVVRLRGALRVRALGVAANQMWATLPTGMRPRPQVNVPAAFIAPQAVYSLTPLTITASGTGELMLPSSDATQGSVVCLDGLVFTVA